MILKQIPNNSIIMTEEKNLKNANYATRCFLYPPSTKERIEMENIISKYKKII